MSRWKWILLIVELALFAAILVLPQVDLPDFAFQCGTAPVVVKARSVSSPQQTTTPVVTASGLPVFSESIQEEVNPVAPSHPESRLALNRVLLC